MFSRKVVRLIERVKNNLFTSAQSLQYVLDELSDLLSSEEPIDPHFLDEVERFDRHRKRQNRRIETLLKQCQLKALPKNPPNGRKVAVGHD